jgi:hypothetical protein
VISTIDSHYLTSIWKYIHQTGAKFKPVNFRGAGMARAKRIELHKATVSAKNQVHLPAEIATAVLFFPPKIDDRKVKIYGHELRDELVLADAKLDDQPLKHIDDREISPPDDGDPTDVGGRITLPSSDWLDDSALSHGSGETDKVIIELLDLDGTSLARMQTQRCYAQNKTPSI